MFSPDAVALLCPELCRVKLRALIGMLPGVAVPWGCAWAGGGCLYRFFTSFAYRLPVAEAEVGADKAQTVGPGQGGRRASKSFSKGSSAAHKARI